MGLKEREKCSIKNISTKTCKNVQERARTCKAKNECCIFALSKDKSSISK